MRLESRRLVPFNVICWRFDKSEEQMRPAIFPDLIQFKAPEGTLDAMRDAAQREQTTKSEIARQALRAVLPDADSPLVQAQAAAGD